MAEQILEIRVSGTRRSNVEKWVEGKSNNAFSSFFAIFDDFSKWSTLKALWNFEKSINLANNEEKPCSTCLQPIFQLISGSMI